VVEAARTAARDHRAAGWNAGPRGLCDPRQHPQSAVARLPRTAAQGAKLVETAADVLSELKIPFTKQDLTEPADALAAAAVLDKDYEILLDALEFEPQSIDTLVERTTLPSRIWRPCC